MHRDSSAENQLLVSCAPLQSSPSDEPFTSSETQEPGDSLTASTANTLALCPTVSNMKIEGGV